MKLTLERFSSGPESTLGLLFIDGGFSCFVCEDEPREVKVPGETRIPVGEYRIAVRTHGGFHARYSQRFPDFHKGMLDLLDVPDFTDILIHVGNSHQDTAGCLLVGAGAQSYPEGGGHVQGSVKGYTAFYKAVIDAVLTGQVTIEIVERDRAARVAGLILEG
jgi:hypothetical protein